MSRCMGTVRAGKRAGLRCRIDGTDRGQGWIGCGFHPRPPAPEPTFDPEYVRIVRARLAEIWERAPVELRHSIEWCMVDLGRALGEVPTEADLPVDLVHFDSEDGDG